MREDEAEPGGVSASEEWSAARKDKDGPSRVAAPRAQSSRACRARRVRPMRPDALGVTLPLVVFPFPCREYSPITEVYQGHVQES
jgi:hypothetical protein